MKFKQMLAPALAAAALFALPACEREAEVEREGEVVGEREGAEGAGREVEEGAEAVGQEVEEAAGEGEAAVEGAVEGD